MVQENTPTCQEEELHPEAIHRVREKLPQDEVLYDLAELFKIFGDSTRVKILYALLEAEELCVCDIASLMDVTQSAVSHQLRVLKSSKLVKFRKEGKTVYYSLADDHVCRILSQGMEHICE
ncbi:MAG: metalloregulator ArsR/SmtB family transcription factor [Clostridiales bacterium]|nr:metalloregulator ArsR/SmtB family transcription factor [Clostridiales bacterium]